MKIKINITGDRAKHEPQIIDLGEDVITVVRCKDCGYFDEDRWICKGPPTLPMMAVDPNHYCAWGTRRK